MTSKRKRRWPKGAWMKLASSRTMAALMEQKGMSLGTLARHAGCSKGFISHLLAGRRSTCTGALGERIAEALDVPHEVLFVASLPPSRVRSAPDRKSKVPA